MVGIDVTQYLSLAAQIAFFVLVIIVTFHILFLAYHWYSYGTSRATSTKALAIYLLGVAVFFIILVMTMGSM